MKQFATAFLLALPLSACSFIDVNDPMLDPGQEEGDPELDPGKDDGPGKEPDDEPLPEGPPAPPVDECKTAPGDADGDGVCDALDLCPSDQDILPSSSETMHRCERIIYASRTSSGFLRAFHSPNDKPKTQLEGGYPVPGSDIISVSHLRFDGQDFVYAEQPLLGFDAVVPPGQLLEARLDLTISNCESPYKVTDIEVHGSLRAANTGHTSVCWYNLDNHCLEDMLLPLGPLKPIAKGIHSASVPLNQIVNQGTTYLHVMPRIDASIFSTSVPNEKYKQCFAAPDANAPSKQPAPRLVLTYMP